MRGQAFPEQAFVCPAWNRESKSAETYLISSEYRLRNTTARFVFAHNEKWDIVVLAVAEEPAKVANSILMSQERDFFVRDYDKNTKVNALQNLGKGRFLLIFVLG